MDLCRQFRPRGECEMNCTRSPDWGQPSCRFEQAWNASACPASLPASGTGGFKTPSQLESDGRLAQSSF